VPPGRYFAKVSTGKRCVVKPFMLMR
jgi:hypothetical protein